MSQFDTYMRRKLEDLEKRVAELENKTQSLNTLTIPLIPLGGYAIPYSVNTSANIL